MSNNLKKLSGLTLVLSLAFSSATHADGDKKEGWRTKVYNKGAYIAIGGGIVAIGAIAYDYMNYKTWYEAQSEEYRDNNQMGLGNYFSDYLMGFKGETPSKVAQIAGVIGGVAGVAGTVCAGHKWWTSSSTPDVKKLEEERNGKKTALETAVDAGVAAAVKANTCKDEAGDKDKLKAALMKAPADRSDDEKALVKAALGGDGGDTENKDLKAAFDKIGSKLYEELKSAEEALKAAQEKDDKKGD